MSRPKQTRLVDLADERRYDKAYREQLLAMGLCAMKIEDKWIRGLPDTYCAPDVWIEFKKVRALNATGNCDPWQYFDPLQLMHLRQLTEAGARTFVGFFWDFGEVGTYIQTIKFASAIKHTRFTHDLVLPFADELKTTREVKQHVASTWQARGGKPALRQAAVAKTELAGL